MVILKHWCWNAHTRLLSELFCSRIRTFGAHCRIRRPDCLNDTTYHTEGGRQLLTLEINCYRGGVAYYSCCIEILTCFRRGAAWCRKVHQRTKPSIVKIASIGLSDMAVQRDSPSKTKRILSKQTKPHKDARKPACLSISLCTREGPVKENERTSKEEE